MATVTYIHNRPTQKQARTVTQPRREPKTSYTQHSKKTNEHFDPEELICKLEAYLAEQKQPTDQGRGRANVKKQTPHQHVPKVTAIEFEKTAAPESMRQTGNKGRYVHKVVQAAVQHKSKESTIPANVTLDLQNNQEWSPAGKHGDLVADHNQPQQCQDLKDVPPLDQERNSKKLPRRTYGTYYLDVRESVANTRPLSTGDIKWENNFYANKPIDLGQPKAKTASIPSERERQDCAQPNEVLTEGRRSVKDRGSPFLRKPDSMWALKGKKDVDLSGEIKHKKSTFLSLFKR